MGALVPRRPGRMLLALSPEAAVQKMLERSDVEERAATIWQGQPRSRSLFLERLEHGFRVWCAPDPERTAGDPAVVPRMIEVTLAPHPGGSRMTVRVRSQPAQRLGLTVLTALSVGAPALWVTLDVPLAVLPPLLFPLVVAWVVIAHQRSIARADDRRAWDAVLETLGPAQLPDANDPYRQA